MGSEPHIQDPARGASFAELQNITLHSLNCINETDKSLEMYKSYSVKSCYSFSTLKTHGTKLHQMTKLCPKTPPGYPMVS